jgi:hypothetical protein
MSSSWRCGRWQACRRLLRFEMAGVSLPYRLAMKVERAESLPFLQVVAIDNDVAGRERCLPPSA